MKKFIIAWFIILIGFLTIPPLITKLTPKIIIKEVSVPVVKEKIVEKPVFKGEKIIEKEVIKYEATTFEELTIQKDENRYYITPRRDYQWQLQLDRENGRIILFK